MSKRIDIHDLTVTYGEIVAVTGLTMHVEQGEVVALLGANGAGKSSTLKAIIGTVRPAHGTINLNGHDVTGQPPIPRPAMVWRGCRRAAASSTG